MKPHRDLNDEAGCGVLSSMADKEKNTTKDVVLWIITVILVAVAIFWYKK